MKGQRTMQPHQREQLARFLEEHPGFSPLLMGKDALVCGFQVGGSYLRIEEMERLIAAQPRLRRTRSGGAARRVVDGERPREAMKHAHRSDRLGHAGELAGHDAVLRVYRGKRVMVWECCHLADKHARSPVRGNSRAAKLLLVPEVRPPCRVLGLSLGTVVIIQRSNRDSRSSTARYVTLSPYTGKSTIQDPR